MLVVETLGCWRVTPAAGALESRGALARGSLVVMLIAWFAMQPRLPTRHAS